MGTSVPFAQRKRLTLLCKQGKLFDALRLLEELGNARFRKTRRWTPLFVAVDRGFHSLVEVLLRFEHEAWDLERANVGALRRHRWDLAGLILRSPWWRSPIDPVEALATGDSVLVRQRIEAGVDFTVPYIVAKACLKSASTTLRAMQGAGMDVSAVRDQLQIAMVTHAGRGHVHGVVRLLRAGVDPHLPSLWFDERDRLVDEPSSAVLASLYLDDTAMLKMLRPSPELDSEEDLIGGAGNPVKLQILLERGFKLNCQSNGGSPALHRALASIGLFSEYPNCDYLRELKATADWLLGRGARWVPRDSGEYRQVRDAFLGLGESEAIRAIERFREAGAIDDCVLRELLRTPRMAGLARVIQLESPRKKSRKKPPRRTAS